MPPQTTQQTGLLARLGAKLTDAQKKFKGRAPEMSDMGLPAGIENGIAQVRELKIGVYREGKNAGQPFFSASAVCVSPAEHAGGQTRIGPEPLCDTPTASGKRKTFADHYEWFRNQLLILGLDIDQFTGTPAQIDAAIVAGMAALKGDPKDPNTWTYTRFRTWKGSKQTEGPYAGVEPRVQHTWGGRTEWNGVAGDHPPAALAATEDGTPPADDAPADDEAPTAAEFSEFGDLDSLVEVADSKDKKLAEERKEAQRKLKEAAVAAGLDQSVIDNADSWAAVLAAIQEASTGSGDAGDEGEDEPAAEGTDPEVGALTFYRLRDKAGKPLRGKDKKELPTMECEVASVDAAKRTVTLRDLSTKRMLVDEKKKPLHISWDHLEEA